MENITNLLDRIVDDDAVETQKEFDKVYDSMGVKIVCDIKSWFYVKGTEIDFSEDLLAGGFKLNNPNANRTCGCGTSFSA